MTNATALPDRDRRWTVRTATVLRFVLAVAFIAAGGAKLAGAPAMIQIFEAIGIGQWFRLATGAVEITGAVLLIVPTTVGLGAALLTGTMACAVLTHLTRIGGNPVPAIVLLLLAAFVLWVRRGDFARFLGRKREGMA